MANASRTICAVIRIERQEIFAIGEMPMGKVFWHVTIRDQVSRIFVRTFFVLVLGLVLAALAIPQSREYFTIKVVDDQTGRGVPLVELTTQNQISYYTDSNGIVAFYEPGLMIQTVYFSIKSDGYTFPADILDNIGVALKVMPGGHAQIKLTRTSIAERLYRITGEGIYRDSVLVGAPVPIKHPLLDAQVMGQDTVLAVPYRSKIYWFWGDTAKPSYVVGNFGTSGATSELPGRGGLDPSVGVDLSYFVDASGFSRPMLPSANFPGPGPKWIWSPMVMPDETGRERLFAFYSRIKTLGVDYEHGIAIFDDKTQSFERLVQFDLNDAMFECGTTAPVKVDVSGTNYYHEETCRFKTNVADLKDMASWEGFSPLVAGTRYEKKKTRLDRAPDGRLRYTWKRDTPPLDSSEEQELIAAGKMTPSEAFYQQRNVDTDERVNFDGTIEWNAFLKRWLRIGEEGSRGAIWFAEGDTPLGPWVYAKQVLRHEEYNFYNPAQHAFFDQDGGRIIYFEGTYTLNFAAGDIPTPRYDYNQIMYRLDLSDPRLALPVPVYLVGTRNSSPHYLLREGLDAEGAWNSIQRIPFFAIPPGAAHGGLIPIFATNGDHSAVLSSHASSDDASPLFYALPASPAPPAIPQGPSGKWSCMAYLAEGTDFTPFSLDLKLGGEAVRSPIDGGMGGIQGTFKNDALRLVLKGSDETYDLDGGLKQGKLQGTWKIRGAAYHGAWTDRGPWSCERALSPRQPESPAIVPLYEYTDTADGSRIYSTAPDLYGETLKRSAEPICRVWRNPTSRLFLDPDARPVLAEPVSSHSRRSQR
jgi:hypothetical protein